MMAMIVTIVVEEILAALYTVEMRNLDNKRNVK